MARKDICNIAQHVSHIKLLGHIIVASVKGELLFTTNYLFNPFSPGRRIYTSIYYPG